MRILLYSSFLFLMIQCIAFGQSEPYEAIRKARELYLSGSFQEALGEYQKAFVKSKSFDSLPEQFQANYRTENFEAAITRYEQEQGRRTLTANEEFNLGNAYFQSSKLEEAIDHYKKAITLNPADKQARHNLSIALRQKNQSKNQNQNDKNKENEKDKQNDFEKEKNQKILDNLAKKELETKSKINNSKGNNSSNSIRKAW